MFQWYYGIKRSYPNLRKILPTKLNALLVNSRPFTILLPLLGGYFIILASLPTLNFVTPDPLLAFGSLLALALINAGGNNVNSIFDVDIDKVNKPYRPIPSGTLTKKFVAVASIKMIGLALVKAWFVNPAFFLICCVLVAMTVTYSTPPRMKNYLWVNNAWQAFIRGVLGVFAAWSVFMSLSIEAVAVATVMFTLIFATQSTKDFPDLEGDKKYGIRTLPVVYGPKRAVSIMKPLIFVPFILLTGFVVFNVLPVLTITLLVLVIPAVYLVKNLTNLEDTRLENSKSWVCFYALLGLFLFGFAMTFHVGVW